MVVHTVVVVIVTKCYITTIVRKVISFSVLLHLELQVSCSLGVLLPTQGSKFPSPVLKKVIVLSLHNRMLQIFYAEQSFVFGTRSQCSTKIKFQR